MNLFAEADKPQGTKLLYLLHVLEPTIIHTFYTVARSKPLSDFLEALSDERLSTWAKFRALLGVWRRPRREPSQRP
jgi:hypothetical protein